MGSVTGYARARDRIAQLCRSGTDARTFRLEALAIIGQVVGFDAYAWLITDPETSVGSSPLAAVPCLPELPQAIRLKYLTAVNRWTGLPCGAVMPGGVAQEHVPGLAAVRRRSGFLWRGRASGTGDADAGVAGGRLAGFSLAAAPCRRGGHCGVASGGGCRHGGGRRMRRGPPRCLLAKSRGRPLG